MASLIRERSEAMEKALTLEEAKDNATNQVNEVCYLSILTKYT